MSDSGAGGAPKPSTDGFNRSQFAKDEEENPLPVTYPVKKESGLDKIKTIFSSNEKEEGAIQEINVVLVGNMGVGKSTLGNYLFNLGDKTNVLFQTSDDPTTASTFDFLLFLSLFFFFNKYFSFFSLLTWNPGKKLKPNHLGLSFVARKLR